MSNLNDKISVLEKVIGTPGYIPKECSSLDQVPVWITTTITIHALRFGERLIYLIEPKKPLTYDKIVSGRELLERRLLAPVLIIADDLNPKYRSLFIRRRVPFIYRNRTLFAPSLGVQLDEMDNQLPATYRELAKELSPFEFKLIAGSLSGQLKLKSFNLKSLHEELQKRAYKCSMGKLSLSVKNLIEHGLIDERGRGPNRTLNFKRREKLWESLHEVPIAKTHRIMEGGRLNTKVSTIISGESALAQFSSLNDPKRITYAMTKKHFDSLDKQMQADDEEKIQFDIRKEDPELFSINGCLNPIEVYFDLRSTEDERVQIALDEMLSDYQMKGIYGT